MEQRYAPYPKWFGSAFQHLRCAGELWLVLMRVQHSTTWQDRETALVEAYTLLAQMHNALSLTAHLPETALLFHSCFFRVFDSEVFITALLGQISDEEVLQVTEH